MEEERRRELEEERKAKEEQERKERLVHCIEIYKQTGTFAKHFNNSTSSR